jgi:hypothetical protein
MALDAPLQAAADLLEARLAPILEQIRPLQLQADGLRAAINAIYMAAGEPVKYAAGEAPPTASAPALSAAKAYGRGEFHGKPLLTAAKQIIGDHGPQTRDELFDTMRAGGFDFGTRSEKDAKDGLAISLGKAHGIKKLGNGCYALDDKKGKEPKPNDKTTPTAAASSGNTPTTSGDGAA